MPAKTTKTAPPAKNARKPAVAIRSKVTVNRTAKRPRSGRTTTSVVFEPDVLAATQEAQRAEQRPSFSNAVNVKLRQALKLPIV